MCVIKFFLEGFCVRLSDADVMVWFSLLSRPRTVCLWREIPVPCIPVTEVTGMRTGSQWDATRKSVGCDTEVNGMCSVCQSRVGFAPPPRIWRAMPAHACGKGCRGVLAQWCGRLGMKKEPINFYYHTENLYLCKP